jgi:hypothetical protein
MSFLFEGMYYTFYLGFSGWNFLIPGNFTGNASFKNEIASSLPT